MRIAIGVEYDGTAYNGWQRQASGTGIQERLEAALSSVAGHPLEVHGAGRTDAGVHASGQVAHFDTTSRRALRGWLLGANSNLPPDISLTWVRPVADDFHARFSATERRYRYEILNRLVRSALSRNRAWWVHRPLDAASMQEAAQELVGRHDFSAFRAAGCQASHPVREVRTIDVRRAGERILIDVVADAFLQRMVRNIVGTLAEVGAGEQPPHWVGAVLKGRDRTLGGMAAPGHGLTLVAVRYPDAYGIPACGVSPCEPLP
ncbi:MAG TPA: tRNA pseudouridine(38-40) synthase TruA [Woeseiaceae bacterium]|nr:tRNA pseudouridine(38-40) synthase TruA [Woeseiaceae bacterium]